MLVRLLYAAAALLAAAGAFLLTWATAYRPPSPRAQCVAFSTAGPFRYVRNPQYISYFLLMLALGTFQSRLGFPVMLLGEALLLLRLVAREELLLDLEYGHSFRAYAQRVPRLLPFLRRRIADDGKCTAMGPGPLGPSLPMGLRGHPPSVRLHPNRPGRLHLRRCNALVFGSAKANTTARVSPASYLTPVLRSSAASVHS
jgi:hypothetical protein